MSPGSRAGIALVAALILAAAGACGPSSGDDAGLDGAPTDFGVLPEGGSRDGGPRDASADAAGDGSVSGCEIVDCDPSAPLACGADAGLCVLRTAAPATCESRDLARGAAGDPCRTAADCTDQLACFAVAGGGGRCGAVCCPGHGTGCTMAEHCEGPAVLVGGDTTSWGRCVLPRTCDVLAGTPCDPGEGCYVVSDRGDTDCRTLGHALAGETCSAPNDCVPGFVCTGLGGARCVRICGLGDAGMPACAAGEGACRAYPYSPPGTGVCTVAAAAAP